MTDVTDTSAKIDAKGAFALLERVVAERGEDYVYQPPASGDCKYLHGRRGNETPGCAVGLAATYAGVSLTSLRRWDRASKSAINHVGVEYFDGGALAVLREFQRTQDNSCPYSEALAEARHALNHTA